MATSNYGIWCKEPGHTGSTVVSETPLVFENARLGETMTLYLLHVRGEDNDPCGNFIEIAGNDSAIGEHAERYLNRLTKDGWRTKDIRNAPPVFTRAVSSNYHALSELVKETYGNDIPYKS